MKFGIISDLHQEFSPFDYDDFAPDIFYLNAGDINSHTNERHRWLKQHEAHMFSVLGNHDYYLSTDQPEWFPDVREVEGVRIAGATLWTDLSGYLDWVLYREHLVDCRFIPNWTQLRYMQIHKLHKEFLLDSKADVIVSHHAPSYLSIHDDFKGSGLNAGFAVELGWEIANMSNPPKLWVHGHTHREMDYMIGSTRVICHPRGYTHELSTFASYKPLLIDL